MDHLYLVVKNEAGLYLNASDDFSVKEEAWKYQSRIAFHEALSYPGSKVFLCFPTGFELEVSSDMMGLSVKRTTNFWTNERYWRYLSE